jgi:hypothetical protein
MKVTRYQSAKVRQMHTLAALGRWRRYACRWSAVTANGPQRGDRVKPTQKQGETDAKNKQINNEKLKTKKECSEYFSLLILL